MIFKRGYMMTVYSSRTCTDIWGNSMEMKGYEQK